MIELSHPSLDREHPHHSPEYAAVKAFYGERRAERSGVLLINHIHEGADILRALGRKLPTGESFSLYQATHAYCLHPLFQNDAELMTAGMGFMRSSDQDELSPFNIMMAMEYRWRANNWLSDKVRLAGATFYHDSLPDAGPIPEVRAMLIADKVQNYKDFLRFHKGTHARSAELGYYFKVWLKHLSVDDALFDKLCQVAEATQHD